MVSAKIIFALVALPIAIYGYTCVLSDSSINSVYNECFTNLFCVKNLEYDSNKNLVKTRKSCDNVCQTNGEYTTTSDGGLTSHYYCCTGDMCNSATTKGLLSLPLMLVTYVLFK